MIGYRFLPPEEEEMIGASHYYSAASRKLGQDFLGAVQRVIDQLREYQRLGQSVGRGLCRMPLKRFPFTIACADEPEAILILAVAHQNRRPGYWRGRLGR